MPEYCVQETKEGDRSMKQPFWKLNFGLLIVVGVLLVVMFFYKIKLQRPYQITPVEAPIQTLPQKIETPVLNKIYQHDLFNTYIGPETTKQERSDVVKPVPPPPQPIVIAPPVIETPKFLDPLPITLTGIFMLNNDAKNRAIIINNKSKEEATYKVGDEIEDAQIIKIFTHKVLLIRSNGQQEMIYLNQNTATSEALKFTQKDWSHVIKKIEANNYLLDKQEFVNEIATISNLIDVFNLSTAYKQGISIGIKLGNFDTASMAEAFGFEPGDIITKINDLPITSTDERLTIYKKLETLPEESTVIIEFLRNEQPIIITVKLGSIIPALISISKTESPEHNRQKTNTEKEQQLNILKQKEKFAPTLREIRLQEKENIIRHQKAAESRKRRGQAHD